ncbi:hypothetical protein HFQ13_10760 [Acidithiobacillus sp. VAN18-1]|uniref:Uncharacterized protein n=1 Tax=Igneacidithiobacillus copahuensis TaxID=2724909 RepID=A0AAE2YQU0_9PROT|nr:hypothetical protein [Igneacidithiobacillus copahuensis]MBU2788672.1 hypothetical protein [Igneacidithiobacillus copahuensis]MBU2796644.1 hypothetical protein [Acidithiobacillus sp. VAN18-2]
MRWRNAGAMPQTVFGLEYWVLVGILPYLVLFVHGVIFWTALLILWIGLFVVLKMQGLRLGDLVPLISRALHGDWRVR